MADYQDDLIEARLADGTVLSFPAGTPDDVVDRAVQEHIASSPTPEDEKDLAGNWFGRNFGAPIARGWNMLEITGAVMANEAGILSDEAMAESVAEDVVDMNKIYMGENVAEGMREIGESKGWIDSAVAIFQNPEAIADTVIQSLVASIPSLAGMVVGMKAGALAGSVVPGPGTVIGGIAGASTGTAMGSFAVEYSNSLISAMVKAGVDTSDPVAVAEFLNDPVQLAKAKEFAVKRGVSVAAFDAISAGIATRIFSPVAKALSGAERVAAGTKLGREAADATRAAMARGAIVPEDKILKAAARDAAKAVTRSLPVGARVAAGTTELAAQMAAGAAGEAVAQVATEGKITSPGEVMLEGIAEGPIGIAETAIGIRGPRIAPEPLAPGEFRTPPTPLSRDQYDQPIEGDPIVFAEEQAVNFAYDTPVSMAGGVPSTDQDDYNIVPFDGTNEQGDGFSGWRVETSTGIPVTPVIANEETAYAARESFADTLDNVIAEQEQLELNDRVNRAMGGEEQAERAPDLAGLAAGADARTTVPYNDLDREHKVKIDAWRADTENSDIVPRLPEGRVAVEELAAVRVSEAKIDGYIKNVITAPETAVTPATIKQIATAKNIETNDDAFQKFAARVSGTSKTKAGSWETMKESQLAAIKERLDGFERIPADENQKHSIPVTEHRPFSGAQYRSVVAHARRQAARDTTYRVERNGKAVPGGTGFNTEREAQRFAKSLPSRKGLKIKGVKIKPLREGEILKSEVKRVLGVKKATNTDAILDAAVERGDLIKVRGGQRGRYRVAEYEIREAQPLMPGLQDRLEARLRGLGIGTKRVSLELVEGLEGPKGVYVNKVIQLALDKLPENATQEEALEILGETLDHETVHALFELGVLTVPEKESLYRFARGARVPRAKGEKGRRLTYFDVAFARYSGLPEYQKTDTEGNPVLDDDGNPEPNFESIMEEGVAEAFRDYAAGRLKPQAQVRTIFSRIVNFFRRMTTLSPADAQYFLMTFSPAREGQYRDSGRGRRPTGMQRDVDVPEGAPGMGRPSRPLARYAIDDPDRQANVKHIWIMEDGEWVPHAALEDDSTSTVMSEARAELSELREQGIKARFGERFPVKYSLDDGEINRAIEYELTSEDRQKIKKLKASVKGLNPLLRFLSPAEQAQLTPTMARNMVLIADKLPKPLEMAAVALSGASKRGWYANSKKALDIVFGEQDSVRFTALLAAMSPQTSVPSNLANALRVWAAWVSEGRPTDPDTIIRIMGENVQGERGRESVFDSWINNSVTALTSENPDATILSGPKVDSFLANLSGFMNEVTNDVWIATFSDIDQSDFSRYDSAPLPRKGPGYLAMNAAVRRAADLLSKQTGEVWTPAEIQETIWSWAKALYEHTYKTEGETRSALEILKSGELTNRMIGEVPDFMGLLSLPEYSEILNQVGYGEQLAELNRQAVADMEERAVPELSPEASAYNVEEKLKPHLNRAARRLDRVAKKRAADLLRSEIVVNLSASTPTIKGLETLTAEANAGDQSALVLLQEVAGDSLSYLTDNIPSAEINFTPTYGLYGGQMEPSLGVIMSFQERDRARALSSVARFATNFNQEQAHVRGIKQPRTRVPHVYDDGSYNTLVTRWNLKNPLSRKEVAKVIKDSGLFGLTVADQYVEVYFVGDTSDANKIANFTQATERARQSLGRSVQNTERTIERLWAYGTGDGATHGYSDIQGKFRPPKGDRASATALRIATRLANRIFKPSQQELTITPEKRALQRRIAEAFDAMDMNALDDPVVFRAYEELASELLAQYDALPIKVEVWKKKGELYGGKKMSAAMRRDVLWNNHLYIYGTEVGTFGPPGVSYENHPMLRDSGRVDINGEPLLFNDLLRAVHDYYAHTMSPVTFGPRGEEAAWRNHMLMINNPWARWALTSETRGQNSFVNFREGVEKLSFKERGFADQKVDLLPLEFVATGDVDVDASLAELPERRARYSLEEDRMLDRIERKRERERQRKAAEEERGFQNVFNGFTNIQPDAFAPIKIYNGGVTPLVVDGKQYPVVMTLGHNQWNDEKQKYVGWGERHAIDHLPDILENTSYKSVDEFVSGVLNMYHANRVEGTLKEANISVFESNDYSDNIRGPKIVIRWKNLADPNWPYPATLVLQVMDFSGVEVKTPELKGKSFASVTTGYALPALDGALEPRPMAALNPDASPMAKGAAGEAKPNEKIDRKLSKKYSLDGRENLPDDYKDPYEKAFGSAPRGPQRSLGEAILNMFSYQDIMTKPNRLRHMIVDVWEPVSAAERTLRKTMPDLYNDIYADSSASAMLSMLGRAAGLTQQYMTVGGIMYTRGMFVAINDRIAANAPPELRDIKQRELADFKARNGYDSDANRDKEGKPRDEVKGLMQIFEPLVELQRVGGYEAWQLYGAARRAQRLLSEKTEDNKSRERLLSDEDIKKGLAIAEDTRFFKDGESVIVKVYEDYQKLNSSLISMMQDANLISPEAATLWRDNGDYMPFYRELYVDDTREGGLDGNVVYRDHDDQDKIRQAADDPNNRVFDNLYNVKAPPQLKGGRMTYFVMVGNTRASPRVFDTIQKAYVERDRLRALNPDMNPSDIDVKSGTQRIRGEKDPLENILRNANAAITGSMRNVGLLRALRDQVRLGMASKKQPGAEKDGVVWDQLGVRVKGETVWYETTDRLLLNSVQATGDLQQHPIFMSLMTVPANVLRELITKSPDFMLANLIRDTVTAWVTSGTNVTPVVGTINGFARALGGSHLAANVAASGITGGFDFKSDPLDISKSMRKYMKRGVRGAGSAKDYLTKGFLPTLRSPLNPVLKLWQFADDITTASDMATRIAVYNKVLRETGSEAQASLEALEVINFSRKGASSTIQYFTAVVPFLNARLQGLDVLWRGASDRGITGHDVQQRKKRYIFRMLTLVALSTAYAMAHSDDPEEDPYYANATAEKKDMYWIIRPEWLGLSPFSIAVPKIPIAFEVGLITKTIPERIVRLLRGQDDLDDTMGSFGRAFLGTLNFNPVPQFIKPLAEAAINLNTYTWRPIVPYYSLTDAPELASVGIGQTSKEIAKVTGVSAERVQHILRGYTGTLGMYALQAADAISRSLAGTAEAPDFNVHQYPFFQRFMQSKWGGGDKQEFYALRGRLEELTNTLRKLESMGEYEEARERRTEGSALYRNKARINYVENILNNLRHRREKIIRDKFIPGDDKKRIINDILQLESEALSGIKKLSMESRR